MFFDNHIHLARLPHSDEISEILLRECYGFIAVACEPWEWEIVEKHPHWPAAYGIHPMIAATQNASLSKLRLLLERHPNAQVGEAGLDKRYPGYEPGGIQEKTFVEQAKMAMELHRDLQIHCVGDYSRIVKILKQIGFGKTSRGRPIFHRFCGDKGIVQAGIPLNARFSLHKDSFRKKSTQEALSLIPPKAIQFETDADENTQFPQDAGPQEIFKLLTDKLKELENRFKEIIP